MGSRDIQQTKPWYLLQPTCFKKVGTRDTASRMYQVRILIEALLLLALTLHLQCAFRMQIQLLGDDVVVFCQIVSFMEDDALAYYTALLCHSLFRFFYLSFTMYQSPSELALCRPNAAPRVVLMALGPGPAVIAGMVAWVPVWRRRNC